MERPCQDQRHGVSFRERILPIMKDFSVFLRDGKIVHIHAVRYRHEGDQHVFERDQKDEDVQFFVESEVIGIVEGRFTSGRARPRREG